MASLSINPIQYSKSIVLKVSFLLQGSIESCVLEFGYYFTVPFVAIKNKACVARWHKGQSVRHESNPCITTLFKKHLKLIYGNADCICHLHETSIC